MACCCRPSQLPEAIRLTNQMWYFGCIQPVFYKATFPASWRDPTHPAWRQRAQRTDRDEDSTEDRRDSRLGSGHSQQSLPSGSTYDSFHRWVPTVPRADWDTTSSESWLTLR